MEIEFEKKYLAELYFKGRAKNKKHRYQPQVIKKYVQTIDKLRAARSVENLYPIKSLNYEKLIGLKADIESVRVDKKYRIEFKRKLKKREFGSITVFSIIELSNHYS